MLKQRDTGSKGAYQTQEECEQAIRVPSNSHARVSSQMSSPGKGQ